ncbi:MAG: thioredoxin-disulfide reductase [Candidatus Omnitrophica bacterium]|nr:thioredoxin-disulfide reductase [Candidatus Omnitrophota bacterium]
MQQNRSKVNMPGDVYDIVIIGGGPAGLTAGLYAARSKMKTLMIESFSVMGQATMTDLIENYPGIEKTNGFDLITKVKGQAVSFGLECAQGTVTGIGRHSRDGVSVWKISGDGKEYETLSVIAASGAYPRKIGVPGEKEFTGKGVSYCATCDGAFFRGKDILVVGGGNTAVEEALYLTKFGKKVTVVHRRDRLRASGVVQERAFASDKIDFAWNSVVEEIRGGEKVESVLLRNVKTDGMTELACDGVFVFIGWNANTGFLEGVVELDEKGAVLADDEMKTSSEGVFAAGDCRRKVLNQIVTACGDGAVAAYSAEQYVQELKGIAYH